MQPWAVSFEPITQELSNLLADRRDGALLGKLGDCDVSRVGKLMVGSYDGDNAVAPERCCQQRIVEVGASLYANVGHSRLHGIGYGLGRHFKRLDFNLR